MPNISLPISGSGMEELYYPNAQAEDTDFIGFTFNGQYSKNLGIYRVSDGNRYNDNLYGSFQDTTVQIPGGDGLYYFRTNYTSRVFNISIAFDSLTDAQLRNLRKVFSANAMGSLIFDEWPYKAYSVKIQSPPQLKYICFDENGSRVYKGEGTINFVSYFPYASSTTTKGGTIETGNTISLTNDGDIETDILIWVPIALNTQRTLSLNGKSLTFKVAAKKKNTDAFLRFNSRTNLIEGYQSLSSGPSGTLYNDSILSGDFFKMPVGTHTLTAVTSSRVQFSELYY